MAYSDVKPTPRAYLMYTDRSQSGGWWLGQTRGVELKYVVWWPSGGPVVESKTDVNEQTCVVLHCTFTFLVIE